MDPRKFIRDYAKKMTYIQEILLEFIDDDNTSEEDFQILIKNFEDHQQFRSNNHDLKMLLTLISKIEEYHHRAPNFNFKIEKIIKYYQDNIMKFFSNSEIFNIFKKNKQILLFLFNEKIIIPDMDIFNIIINNYTNFGKYYLPDYYKDYHQNDYPKYYKYLEYFYPEFRSFYSPQMIEDIETNFNEEKIDLETFEEERRIGENHWYLSKLIRNDQIDEFITYISQTNLPLNKTTINDSIFETNIFLYSKKPSLIQYASFFGSIKIAKYLLLNGVNFDSNIFEYVIHSNNQEIFHLFEEDYAISNHKELLKLAICCHHNDFVNYISELEDLDLNEPFEAHYFSEILDIYNFTYINENCFGNEMDDKDLILLFCKFDYYPIVEFFVTNKCIDINWEVNWDEYEIIFNWFKS